MKHLVVPGIVAMLFASSASGQDSTKPATPQASKAEKETRYLAFQIFTSNPDPRVPEGGKGMKPLGSLPGKAALRDYIEDIKQRIGTVGDQQTRLAVMLGPLSFDHDDAQITKFVELAFSLALETDVAVGFHLDDSMFWARRKDLWSDPKNVEALDWDGTPSTGRRLDWGPKPDEAPPQMCFNSKVIQREVQQRSAVLGKAILAGMSRLQQVKKPELFAGVIAGWETMIGQDFKTGKHLGYRALLNRGFSREHPPQDLDLERAHVVKEFLELWGNSLHSAGVPREKIFCHIAFTSQGLRAGDAKESYTEKVHFALPEVAFSSAYRPGFSTYPEGATLKEVQAVLARHGSPGWISAEGTNVSPTSMPGEPNMETYLGRMFNHGAVMVNVFAWGIGGEAMRNNFFRQATENPEALASYAKFLRHGTLVESAPSGFSSEAFQTKMRRIQAELPGWVQKSGQQARVMPLTRKLEALIKGKQWQEVDKVADELLALMKGDSRVEAKPEALPLMKRLPPKIHRIQKELPAWIEKADAARKGKATGLMQKLQDQINAKNFEEVEKTADSLLKMMGANEPAAAQDIPEEARTKPEAAPLMERLPAKVQKIQKELPAWIEKTGNKDKAVALMQKLGGYLDAKNLAEAEKVADSILKMMSANAEPPPPTDPVETMHKRITGKVERITEGVQKWAASGRDPSAILKTMQEKVGPLLDAGKVSEAEPELDRVLEQLGQPKAEAQDKEPPPTGPAPPGSVWYTVGNLSVPLLTRAWGSPIAELMRKSNRLQELMPKAQISVPARVELEALSGRLSQLVNTQRFEEAGRMLDRMLVLVGQRGALPEGDPRADLARERSKFLLRARAAGADGVEDYIGWAVVETKPGQWDWSAYQENAREIRKAGLKYIPYIWVQNLPSWVRQGADYRFATCLEHGKTTEALSIFSPKTVEAYDRVFAQLKAALGPQIDALRIGSPTDYGETHYPAGNASQAFPVTHIHMGWWVQEPEAQQHFRRWVEKKYGSVDRLNAAWGTQFTGFAFDYPRDPTSPRRWLDFVEWYHEALIEQLGVLFDVARKHFPETPICVNLGWPFEKIVLGQDLSGLVKMLASKGMIVRTPTGPMVPHLYTRRVTTAAQFYHVPKLSTEPMDGSAPPKEIAGALFKDLTTGARWHFDYLDNMERAPASFQHARSLPHHEYPRIDAAIFFSTTAHRLENWELHEGFQGGYPEGMAPWLEGLRDILDYDVVDERLIDDGALRTYRLLIWPFGTRVESRTMDKIRDWVEHGGTLLVRDLAAVRTVEGNRVTMPAGQGRVVDAGGSLEQLTERVRTRDRQMTGLPPLDARPDGVLTSLFDDGILLFNRNAKEATVELPIPAGRWDVDYPGLPGSITLPPLAIRWLERQGIPKEGLRKLRHDLGGPFLVSRDKVQEELKLTEEQKEKLEQRFRELLPDAMRFFQKIEGLKLEEREKELGPYRPKMREKLAALLKETLNKGQRTRLRQLELQKEGLRDGDIWNDLQVTDKQRRQFMALMQQALKEIYPLLEEAQKSGNPKKIQPKVIKIRDNLEATMEALLTDAQKTQWKEMLGKPMDHLDDLFDL